MYVITEPFFDIDTGKQTKDEDKFTTRGGFEATTPGTAQLLFTVSLDIQS